jgi:uncharacterized NAD(P)/FAD-binding protein YdhS
VVSVGIVGGGAAAVSLLRQLPISRELSIADGRGGSVPGLYALGEIASGDLYYISSIAKIRRRAHAIALRVGSETAASHQLEVVGA